MSEIATLKIGVPPNRILLVVGSRFGCSLSTIKTGVMKHLIIVLIATALFSSLEMIAGQGSGQTLYQALLNTKSMNLPLGFGSVTVSKGTAQQPGLMGEVDLDFKGSDSKARLSYYVFTDFNSASDFNRNHLPKYSRNQKLLAFPPMARCLEMPGSGGHCDMWIQDKSVILVAEASAVNGGADALIAFGFRHLNSVSP